MEQKSWNKKFNWCDPEETLEDWFNSVCGRINWNMFESQEQWIYMINELGEGRKPKIKSWDAFRDAFNAAYEENVGFMKSCMLYGFLKMYADSDIDLDLNTAWELNDYCGFDEDEPNAYKGVED